MQAIRSFLAGGTVNMALWQRLPLNSKLAADSRSWQWWDRLRTHCQYHAALGLLLDVADADADAALAAWQATWHAEPVRALAVPARRFAANRKGFPVLAAPLQQLAAAALAEGVQARPTLRDSSTLQSRLLRARRRGAGHGRRCLLPRRLGIWKSQHRCVSLGTVQRWDSSAYACR